MKKGWTYKSFADCIDKVSKQKQVKSKDYKSSGLYPIVSQEKELISGYWDDESFLYKHTKPVIIFGDHTKEIKFIDFDFVVGADGTQILSPKEGIDAKFFYYALKATPLRTLGYARHFKLLKEKSFLIPPFSEQHAIVARLDAAFTKIDALKANAEKQLSEARQLFQAELTECMRPKEGWEEKTLKELSIIAGDYGLNVSSKPFDGVRYLRITDITDLGDLNDDKVSANLENEKKQEELKDGDVLFARTGATVGKTLVFRKEFGECLYAGYLIRYRLKKDVILPRYMHYVTHSNEYYDWVATNQAAAAQPNISAKKYNLLSVRYPFLEDQHRIVSHLDSLSAKVRELEEVQRKTMEECDALKQAMLREVFE